jgi:hypothetical protein
VVILTPHLVVRDLLEATAVTSTGALYPGMASCDMKAVTQSLNGGGALRRIGTVVPLVLPMTTAATSVLEAAAATIDRRLLARKRSTGPCLTLCSHL